MTKKQAVDLAKFRGKFKYSEVKVSECTNGTFQVRNKNIGVNIDDLKDSIEVSGLIQPIGVARSEVTEGSDLYKWEIVWGQRRHYAFESLGLETIPAMVGMDQHGNEVSFDDIKGPNGAYIVFHRSADW